MRQRRKQKNGNTEELEFNVNSGFFLVQMEGLPMFLLILEDGSLRKAKTVSDDDLTMCNDGILGIINLNTDEPMQYHDGDWHDIDE